MPVTVSKKLVSKEVATPSPRSSFLLHGVLRRIPGYLFFLIHLCFIHILWGHLVDELFTASLTLRAGNASTTETVASAVVGLCDVFRRSVDQTLGYGLKDALRTKSGRTKSGTVTIARDCLLYLWKSPSSMVFTFGLAFVSFNLLLTAARVVGALFTSITSPCRSNSRLQRGGSRRAVPLHIIARYGNGYDSVLRFFLAAVEMTWFMSYPVMNSATVLKNTVDAVAQAGRQTEPTYASLRQLQARQQSIASFQIEASLMLPPQLFDDAAEAVAAGRFVLLFVKTVLGLVLAVDAQRLFHAFVGVRPLAIPNGWERCPVCGALWKKSRTAKDEVHLCPIIFATKPLTASSSSDSGEEQTTAGEDGAAATDATGEKLLHDKSSEAQRVLRTPEGGVRPGDAFPDPNYVSYWSFLTDSWLSPLLNFTLLAPFSTFSPPSISSITDDGRGHWKSLLRIVDRLPRMPHNMRTRDNIDEPAWDLWQRRGEAPRPGEVSRLETTFMSVTAPIRHLLGRAFAIFFLPAPPPADDAKTAGDGRTAKPPARKGYALFRIFLRHPSGREFVYLCAPLKITQDLLALVAPRVVKSLVSFLKEVSMANVSTRQSYLGNGLLICLSLILAVSLQALFFQAYLRHLYTSSLKASSALKTLLLRQSLETPLAYTGGGKKSEGAKPAHSPLSPNERSPKSPPEDGKRRKKSSPATPLGKPTSEAAAAVAAAQSSVLSREGEVMSLLTVDTTNCGDCIIFLHNVWGHPFVIVSSLLSMYSYVGLFSTLATFAALIALIPLNRGSAARVRTAQQQAKNNESRLSDLTAAVSSMRTVKSMALEECLVERLEEAREKESDGMKRVGRAESVAAAQTEVTTLLVALVCCGSYLLTGGAMDASVLVPTMAALQVMRFPVWTLPHLYSQVSRGYTSMLRIERYLTEHETGEAAKEAYIAQHRLLEVEEGATPKSTKAAATKALAPVRVGEVRCECSTFAWNTQKALEEKTSFLDTMSRSPSAPFDAVGSPPADGSTQSFPSFSSSCGSLRQSSSSTVVLHDIALDVAPGEFVVIQGSTGSGKSALLLAMLRELYVMPNEILPGGSPSASSSLSPTVGVLTLSSGFRVGGRVAYCAEVPWLRQGSVRENIRLLPDDAPESAKERKWYRRVLEACALEQDLSVLAKGDRTMVGEGGTKLSGGQRARVALARAVYRYRETDVFIFDDVLSALDVEVQKHIIAKLFHGLLSGGGASATSSATKPRRTKTIIFATHTSVSLLLPDRVLYLWADGTLHEDGGYKAPTADQIAEQKEAWHNATVAAAESKDTRRSKQETAGDATDPFAHPNLSADVSRAAATPTPEASPSPVPAQGARSGIGFLLPRAADLHRLFIEYLGGSRLLLFFVLSVAMQVFRTLMDNWLGVYISLYDKRNAAFESILRSTKSQRARKLMLDMLSLIVLRGDKSAATPAATAPAVPMFVVLGYPVVWQNPFVFDTVVMQFLGTYAVIGLSAALLSMIRTDYFFRSYQRMADALQLHAVRRLFKAPVSYFDCVPSSRLLQVLSRDQEVVDRSLGESVQLIFLTVLQLLGMVLFNTMHFGAFIAVLPISALLFYHLTVRFLSFTKQVRALEGVLMSRSLGVVKDAVKGAITVRAFGDVFQDQLLGEMNEALDAVHVAASAGLTADRWVALRLEFVALAFTSVLALLSVLTVCLSATASAGSAAFAGLGIISSMTASRSLSMLCRRFGMFQNQFVSAEQLLRLEEEIPQETQANSRSSSGGSSEHDDIDDAGAVTPAETAVPGKYSLLDVRHLCAKYQPQLPWVLSDICFSLRPGECVGLIGRTGNGKSSIFNALLGLMDVVDGEILIPHGLVNFLPHSAACRQESAQLNALQLPQHELRKHYFELVSQEPLLLQGTCRSNLLLGYDKAKPEPSEGTEETSGSDSAAAAESIEARLREVLCKVSLHELLAPSVAAAEAGGEEMTAAKHAAGDAGVADPVNYAAEALVDPATRALDHLVTAGGANLSAGQRQLLCFARAILHHPRVILLDEVSSRVDRRTDELIQKVIKEEMLNRRENAPALSPAEKANTSGVLLIAHRLETILSMCDRVLVIEQGRCVANLSKEEVSGLDDLESYL
ncbi:putative ATP-binding cassette protein subfamily C member 8 [Leptomonas pyrrhocoris]|uniref:Putative ATP-binding cassette protein subfamily C member 8 n=1 Tax=Leptomonas pyrrhocoris TaxID=157538 RepID=A0A0M9G4Q5_LEPPY|nr:putative ATP-binding cassette protein subfamily C member 8 [Leptomonas pyrrhocoris]KPA82079.1 putative ATP-binding cassette protein subfamily C member 8 [Leptomonas pyrrhocoris]|eukprot:XP_015660518.1 putative ATP-binding cassette protein subfamily C member 8 [Leptomonas pyrrhocoris]